MRRIDDRTVELTPAEQVASDLWDELLDKGYGILDAVAEVRKTYPDLDPAFYDEWLSQ